VDALGLERFALIGHSTGALNAWVYAARHPERVAAVVIEDMHAAGRGPAEVETWRTWLASWPLPFPTQLAVRAYFARLRPSLADYFAELFEECPEGWQPVFATGTILETIAANEARDWWDELRVVGCPALVVKGADSDYLTEAEAERMASTLPQGRLAVIPGANHTVHVDQTEAYLEAVAAFLAEAVGGLSSSSPRPSPYRSPRSAEAGARAPGPA
jgi:pimeloyl-ACP methyl ester carboxylesterase